MQCGKSCRKENLTQSKHKVYYIHLYYILLVVSLKDHFIINMTRSFYLKTKETVANA